ncbi:MAG: fatty acyl-AMP ligase, partial [Cyanobacteria bacterium P01_D01_bin.36]
MVPPASTVERIPDLQQPPQFGNFIDILRWRATQQPNTVAYTYLVDGESQTVSLTYRELYQQATDIAQRLIAHQLTGARALLLYPSGLEFVSAFLGCLMAGVIAIPAYPPRPNRSVERIQAIAQDSQAAIVLSTGSLSTKFSQQFLQNSELSKLKTFSTDGPADSRNRLDSPKQIVEQIAIKRDDIAFLQYTSGSTGKPKGVMVSHKNLLENSADLDLGWDHTAKSVIVTWLPVFHDMGLIYGVLQPLYKGIPCYMMSPTHFLQRPLRWLQAISKYKGTHSAGPNFAYANCVHKIKPEQRAGLDLSSWKMALNGAEPVRADTLQSFATTYAPYGFKENALCPGYGLAEATLKVAAARAGAALTYCQVQTQALEDNRVVYACESDSVEQDVTNLQTNFQTLVGCGWTEIKTKILIVDPHTQTICDDQTIGEIWVGGETVAQGYWQRPEATEQTFNAYISKTREGPFLRTGDLGFVKDQELFVTGRLKDLMIIRGRNHYPQDI